MGSTIFQGTRVATLKDALGVGKDASSAPQILNSTTDPTSVATAGNPGSLLLNRSTGGIYKKNDSGTTTNWVLLATTANFTDTPTTLGNMGLEASVSGSALTVSLKQSDGATDPTGGSPVSIAFRGTTLADGDFSVVDATAAATVTVPNTGTLGTRAGTDEYLYVYAINNAGTVETAITSVFKDEGILHTTVAVGTGSDGDALYSTTIRSNVAIRLLGRMKSNQTIAGQWDAVPTEISLASKGVITPPYEYVETLITSNPTTTTGDVAVQSSESIELSPGPWTVGYNCTARYTENGGAARVLNGYLSVHDGTAKIEGSQSAHAQTLQSSTNMSWMAAQQVDVDLSVNTSFTMQLVCAIANTSGTLRIEDSDTAGGLSGNDNASKLWARRRTNA